MSAMIGNLAVSLTMQTAAFQRGATIAEKRAEGMKSRFQSATTSVGKLGAALGVAFSADILYRMAAGAFEMGSNLSEAAEKAGVTVEALQELNFAAAQTGVSQEALSGALVKLSRSVAQAEAGSKPAIAALQTLGLTAADLAGKTPDQQFRLFAEAIKNSKDQGAALAAGMVLTGRGFAELRPLVNGGAAALDAYANEARETGILTNEQAKALDDVADKWTKFKGQAAVAIAGFLADAIPFFQAIGAGLDGVRARVAAWRDEQIAGFQMVGNAISSFVIGIKTWITDKLGAIWDGAIAKIRQVENAFKWLYDRVIGHSWIPDLVDGAQAEFSRLSSVMGDQAETVAVRVEKTFKDMAEATLGAFSRLTSAIKGGGFLNILEAVIGVGLQLGSIGVFGSKVATRINNPAGSSPGYVNPPRTQRGGTTIQVNPSPYFDVVVDSRIGNAAPSIMAGGATIARAGDARSKKWSLA